MILFIAEIKKKTEFELFISKLLIYLLIVMNDEEYLVWWADPTKNFND